MKRIALIFLLLVSCPSAFAFNTSNANYTTHGVFVMGSGNITDGTYITKINIGQILIGIANNSVYKASFGFFQSVAEAEAVADTTIPIITISSPVNTTTLDHTPLLNVTIDDVSTLTYSIDGGTNISACSSCTSYLADGSYLYTGTHSITYYAINTDGLIGESSVVWTITDYIEGGGGEVPPAPPDIPPEVVDITVPEIPEPTIDERLWDWFDSDLWVSGACKVYDPLNYTIVDVVDGQPIYAQEEPVCSEYRTITKGQASLLLFAVLFLAFSGRLYEYFRLISQKKVIRKKAVKKRIKEYSDIDILKSNDDDN